MTFLIAAAGTGGHVFPGLAVGEALVDLGVARSQVLYVGGDRLAESVYPAEGFDFLQVGLRGLKRSLSPSNLRIPAVVLRARAAIVRAIEERGIRISLGMGGYVTIPTALAAKKAGIPLMIAEQNAHAGLANRVSARWSVRSFGSFPKTTGMPAEWVGNPVREPFWEFNAAELVEAGRRRYGLTAGVPTLGVAGGSLGARAINDAIADMVQSWEGPSIQVVHLTGKAHIEAMTQVSAGENVVWSRRGFEDAMEYFYAVSDLVITRAGGGMAELAATGTPAIVVPGSFGSAGHQAENAEQFEKAGMAVVLEEPNLSELESVVERTLFDPEALTAMASAAVVFSKPRAAHYIAAAMMETAA